MLLPIVPGHSDAVAKLLKAFTEDPARIPFAKSTTTHFATISIIPKDRWKTHDLPESLLFATSISGPARAHVRELVGNPAMLSALTELFSHCAGYDDDTDLERFILKHRHADTYYSGMQYLSPLDVRQHRQLRDEIEKFIDANQALLAGMTPAAARAAIQEHIRKDPSFDWTKNSFAPNFAAWWALHWRTMMVPILAVPILASFVACPWLILPALGFAAYVGANIGSVFLTEADQTYVAQRQPDAHVKMLAATQNRAVINEFVVAGAVKEEGFGRPLTLRIAMWIVARVVEGIPGIKFKELDQPKGIPTVATARWIAADRGRRLIFISNYTNAAEPYVRDFIDVPDGAENINITFGFGRGYPKTRRLFHDGAVTDPNGFIYVVTAGQKVTGFWYGPYTDMTIDNIGVNRKIREGLFDPATDTDEKKLTDWLNLL